MNVLDPCGLAPQVNQFGGQPGAPNPLLLPLARHLASGRSKKGEGGAVLPATKLVHPPDKLAGVWRLE